ncbi:tyrosine kinase receptor Cad96Ca [Drosophila grimshawi]|uniref:receptor protein-tyrosine kinase n=1 Tax=Drosophila grimshawi TaxID=7222 RepID=B4JHN3_DROGR|nr:tyrosine kinase receptor Cad96Ca [Drosophila grimshawi]EDV93872.1 GH19569 [Drosophila grimshawi]
MKYPFERHFICKHNMSGTSKRFSIHIAILVVIVTINLLFTHEAIAQEQNAPPILYVRERNWRISEAEVVGQIIDRVHAEDADGDSLVFGIEPRFLAPGSSQQQANTPNKIPFRIDADTGVVYLNESLAGRAGENFLIYITVTDGRYIAKNEVFINILGERESNGFHGFGSRSPPSISNVVQNISQYLPSFDQLPGVQSIRNGLPNRRPSINLPPGFPANVLPAYNNFYPPISTPPVKQAEEDNTIDVKPTQTPKQPQTTRSTTLTKLTPVGSHGSSGQGQGQGVSQSEKPTETDTESKDEKGGNVNTITLFTIKSTSIPFIIIICGISAFVAAIFGYLCRRRLCAISKTLKKATEKEELAKKSNASNTLTDDSRNSMVLQQWQGPVAFANRYVPWEREQQLAITSSQLSTNPANSVDASMSPSDVGQSSPSAGLSTGRAALAEGGLGTDPKEDQWEFPRHRLKFFNILGEGAFGQVWRCEASDMDDSGAVTTVAVKTLKESAGEVEKKDLLSELEVMKTLEPHVNVVRLLGCCTDKDPTFVILEYVTRGKLQTYLRNSRAERHYGNTHGKSNLLTSGDLTSFMYQVAKGMDYLTSRGIIHRDLAARNILITEDHTCKVADFGFARDIITSKIYERKSEGKLPIRWMATESLYDNIFSVKSDIWSFGILMWEIVTLGSTPYPGISAADVMRKVRDGYRLEKPEHCRRELYNIMYYCWSQDVNERPTFAEIIKMLDKLLHTEMDYIELERFPDHNYYNIVNLSGEKL